MQYAYQLRAHANARYQQSLLTLSVKELACMLSACGINAPIAQRTLGGAPFLCFDCEALTPAQTAFLSAHSSVYMTCLMEGDLLRPLDGAQTPYLPAGMPDVLKYKGKTNAAFTHLLLNLSLSAGEGWRLAHPLVLDPLCGRGTTLFCALERGMDACGVESSASEIHDAVLYAQKWLQYNRVKHETKRAGLTLPGGRNAPLTSLTVRGERSISFLQADTRDLPVLGQNRFDALAADLPYGVQHAPLRGGRMDTLTDMLRDALPAWRRALKPGAAAAIAFNTYTLPRASLRSLAMDAGFKPLDDIPYGEFAHWVEQAVNRDVLVAVNPRP